MMNKVALVAGGWVITGLTGMLISATVDHDHLMEVACRGCDGTESEKARNAIAAAGIVIGGAILGPLSLAVGLGKVNEK